MVVVAQTRSGLDQRKPSGEIALSRGAFAASQASAHVGFGTERYGSFSALDAINSGRFFDTPELVALHADGNAENVIERLDYKATDKTSLKLNLSDSHPWFQTPNTYDQQAQSRTNGRRFRASTPHRPYSTPLMLLHSYK